MKFKSVEEYEKSIEEYFANEPKPTITGLALHLDCDVETIKNYTEKDEFSRPTKKAYLRVQNSYEKRLDGWNVTGAIFALKNFGWKDKQEVEQTSTIVDVSESVTDDQAKKIAERIINGQ